MFVAIAKNKNSNKSLMKNVRIGRVLYLRNSRHNNRVLRRGLEGGRNCSQVQVGATPLRDGLREYYHAGVTWSQVYSRSQTALPSNPEHNEDSNRYVSSSDISEDSSCVFLWVGILTVDVSETVLPDYVVG